MARDGGDYAAGAIARDDIGTADDYLGLAVHGTSHVDALCHLWYGGALYNGFGPTEIRSSGAARLGIDKIPPIVGRGVLLDIAGRHGAAHLEPGYEIGPEELDACAKSQGVEVGPGDVLLVRTGWVNMFAKDEPTYHRLQPGITAATVPWIVERDVVAVGADNGAVERFPDAGGTNVPVHRRLIRDYGVHLLELLVLEELAAAGVHEFLFVAAPLRIKRGAGSPLNPLAIV
jgi:kynurenine formamidase